MRKRRPIEISVERLYEDAKHLVIEENSYIRSYPSLVAFLASRELIDNTTFVVAAHMVYGWMRTTLRLGKGSLDRGAELITRALRLDASFSEAELNDLKQLVNNSMVGTSKLLHFANPSMFAIWDSRVYYYICACSSEDVTKPASYLCYLTALRALTLDSAYDATHEIIQRQVSYPITRLRSAELIMFVTGQKQMSRARLSKHDS